MTDGSVTNPDAIISLVRKNNDKASVHTFGVGAGSSKYLVKEVAIAGKGTYSFVEETQNLKAKVIGALKRAMEPCISDCKITWNN